MLRNLFTHHRSLTHWGIDSVGQSFPGAFAAGLALSYAVALELF